jgi:hypothetical protein
MELTELNIEINKLENQRVFDYSKSFNESQSIFECYRSYIDTYLETGVHKSNTIFKYIEMDNLIAHFTKTNKSIVSDGLFITHLMLTTEDKKLFEDNLIEATMVLRPEKAYELIMKLLHDNYNGNPPCELEDEYIIPYKHGTLAVINCKTVPYDFVNIKARMDTVAVGLGDKVETIPRKAFSECVNIERVVMADSVTNMWQLAFKGCTSLTSVVLSRSLPEINNFAFCHCVNLRNIEIPDSVIYIFDSAFLGCARLQKVVLPKKLEYLGGHVFETCIELQTITIPDSLDIICTCCFRFCIQLKTIVLPRNLTGIESHCFKDCISLEAIVLPDSLTNIGGHAFHSCHNLKKVVLPPLLEKIYWFTFYDCQNLRSVILPSSLKNISGYGNFDKCPLLDSIIIPKSLENIDGWTFNDNTKVIYEKLFNSTSRFSMSYITALTKHTLKNVKLPLIYGNGK